MEEQIGEVIHGERHIYLIDGIVHLMYTLFHNSSEPNDKLTEKIKNSYDFDQFNHARKNIYYALGHNPSNKRSIDTCIDDIWSKLDDIDKVDKIRICCPYGFIAPDLLDQNERSLMAMAKTTMDLVDEKLKATMNMVNDTMTELKKSIKEDVAKQLKSQADELVSNFQNMSIVPTPKQAGQNVPSPSYANVTKTSERTNALPPSPPPLAQSAPPPPSLAHSSHTSSQQNWKQVRNSRKPDPRFKMPPPVPRFKSSGTSGTQTEVNNILKVPLRYLFIYGADPSTSSTDIASLLKEKQIDVKVEDIACMSKSGSIYNSFKIGVSAYNFEKALDANTWPTFIKVRRFYFKRNISLPDAPPQSPNLSEPPPPPKPPSPLQATKFSFKPSMTMPPLSNKFQPLAELQDAPVDFEVEFEEDEQ